MGRKCQSCGMPLAKDENGGGSNKDGSTSTLYCSLCYQNGVFLHPDFSAKDMQDYCVEQLTKRGMPRFMAWIFTRGIPSLDRWKIAES
ncbi:zinc ribbon domain-containing protein [Hoeflea prorocentri]|uniref:Zinc ribbon domain-containing protein n=1 Tax=Hoeflea prorocentri TaxID=1922333 RepID=A0A9X3ZH66_9HYPH|nr:zinc ribbon domain-containing protein [Hoeflea prorocentri]MCY6380954.1 zinc ribbon domain-containing protein [Hoeflea prorocentri]MDA5398754.1 zinc ribbon domain-containing protein [Hoeflea prorocentri]